MRVARGLFRLWLVLSVLWIGGVGLVTWQTFPVDDWVYPPGERPERNPPPAGYVIDPPAPSTGMFDDLIPKRGKTLPQFDPSKPYTVVRDKERWEAVRTGTIVALVPPAFVLALGSALVWAFRGFR
jgi:hypothetical protein